MESTASEIKSLFYKARAYAETSIELYKLQAVDATAEVVSALVVRMILGVLIAVFSLFVNIGLALWIGEALGTMYLGFFTVSLFYVIVAVFFYIFRESIVKSPIANFMIAKLMSEKKSINEILIDDETSQK